MNYRSVYVFVIIIVMVFFCGCSQPTVTIPPATDTSVALTRFTTGVNATLQEMDHTLATAAEVLGRTGIAGPKANVTLEGVVLSSPHAVDAVTISPEGLITAVMPGVYWGVVGTDVGNESYNQLALEERCPLMTPVFPAAEGFNAVSIRRPVTDSTGTFLGLAAVLFDPQELLAYQADHALEGTNYTAWAVDTGGTLIYDRDPSDLVGLNMLTDPAFADYPDLVALVQRIVAEPSGSGTYTFPATNGGPDVVKDAVWATAGLHGTEWRLVVASEE